MMIGTAQDRVAQYSAVKNVELRQVRQSCPQCGSGNGLWRLAYSTTPLAKTPQASIGVYFYIQNIIKSSQNLRIRIRARDLSRNRKRDAVRDSRLRPSAASWRTG